jgi:predicted ABC-type ATPase
VSSERPLLTNPSVESFFKGVLEIDDEKELCTIIPDIVSAELFINGIHNKNTLVSEDYRDMVYRGESERGKLRERIKIELSTFGRMQNDDEIELGKGGALPCWNSERCDTNCNKNGVCHCIEHMPCQKQAYILIGLPASGKSTIASMIADKHKAIIIDSDYAKRKFPEYRQQICGAHLVHEESQLIIMGDTTKSITGILGYCTFKGYNIVYPTIGHTTIGVLKVANELLTSGYAIHLILVSLDRKDATIRTYNRFKKTRRYVPLSKIYDYYGNNPTISYFRLKESMSKRGKSKVFSSYGEVSSENGEFKVVDKSKNSPLNSFDMIIPFKQ